MANKQTYIEADELIIGAGLTGLTYGLTSQSDDYHVIICESQSKPGGYATNFLRNKRKLVFDCSQHKITGLGINGNVRDALQRVNVWNELDFKYYDTLSNVVVNNKQYRLPVGIDNTQRYLIHAFPSEEKGIVNLFDDIKSFGYQSYMFAKMLLGEYQLNRDILPESRQLQKISTHQYFSNLFNDKDLINLLGAIAIYLGAISKEANAFYFLHYLYAAFETSPGYIEGTCQKLSNTLANKFKQNGGIISYLNPVEKIVVKNDQIHEVITKKHIIKTSKILATCSPKLVMDMLPENYAESKFQENLNALEIGWGHFCVYLATDIPPENIGISDSEYLVVGPKGDHLSDTEFVSEERYKTLTLSITNYHKIDPSSGQIVQLIVLDHSWNWFQLKEHEYETQKQLIGEILIERACKLFPELKNHISYIEYSTPRTNYKYTNSPGGSAFGYKILPGENMRFLSNPPIEGIKFIGGWSTGPGYETGICLGFSHAILEQRKRQSKIIHHDTK